MLTVRVLGSILICILMICAFIGVVYNALYRKRKY